MRLAPTPLMSCDLKTGSPVGAMLGGRVRETVGEAILASSRGSTVLRTQLPEASAGAEPFVGLSISHRELLDARPGRRGRRAARTGRQVRLTVQQESAAGASMKALEIRAVWFSRWTLEHRQPAAVEGWLPPMSFTHLHLHTQYSLLDGAIRMKDLIKTVKAKGMTAVAVTDHGNMFGAIDFYKKAKERGRQAHLRLRDLRRRPNGRTDRTEKVGQPPHPAGQERGGLRTSRTSTRWATSRASTTTRASTSSCSRSTARG